MGFMKREIIPQRVFYRIKRSARNFWQQLIPITARYRGNDNSVLQCCISYNKYGGYCVPTSSLARPAAQKIISGKVYEPDTINFLAATSRHGDIVHAGAYFGDFLPALSKSLGSDFRIWAFEPNPENYRCALMTIFINDLLNVEIRNAGLGKGKTQGTMIISDQQGVALGGGSKILSDENGCIDERTILVEIVSLDDVIPSDRQVAVIHLDVEGYELPALAGSLRIIKQWKPILIVESMPDNEWFDANIISLGYRLEMKLHRNSVFVAS